MESKTMIIIYVVGFVVNLLFWIKFGKKLGFDYSGPKTYANCDDWNSNAEAFTAWSLFWPITSTIFLICGFLLLLTKMTEFLIKKSEKKEEEPIENEKALD